MQEYISVTFYTSDPVLRDQLSAMLSTLAFEGIDESDDSFLIGYVLPALFRPEQLQHIAASLGLDYTLGELPATNWNAAWESNFSPVSVDDFVYIKAPFHPLETGYEFVLQIMPKMSFGTGHHATTQLMMKAMRHLDFTGKSVLDFGSGTGVLAILAEKLGASRAVAMDNEPWSVENAAENAEANDCRHIQPLLANALNEVHDSFDFLLANINLHVLQANAQWFTKILKPGGTALFSGLLAQDEPVFTALLTQAGMQFDTPKFLNGWMMVPASC